MNLRDASITAFVATTDGRRARHFYETTLGLRLITDDDFALAFDCHGVELRVQKVNELQPHPFTALGWRVPDVHATIAALVQRGIAFERYPFLEQDDVGVWHAPSGAKVAWFKDPDGNLLSVTEVPRRA